MSQSNSPQAEHGHTDIANELMEELAKTELSGYEWRYLIFLLRKTYGFHKKEDEIPNSQFVKATGISRQHINRTQNRLIKRGIVAKNGYKLSFQKDYTLWIRNFKLLPKMATVAKNGTKVAKLGYKSVAKNGVLKRKDTKETSQKKPTNVGRTNGHAPSSSAEEGTLFARDTNFFIGLFKDINPGYTVFFRNKTEREAIEDLRKQVGDDRLEELILGLKQVIYQPFAPRITSPYKLLVKYGDLVAFVAQGKTNGAGKYSTTQV